MEKDKKHGKDKPRFLAVKQMEQQFKQQYAIGLGDSVLLYLKKLKQLEEQDNNTTTE